MFNSTKALFLIFFTLFSINQINAAENNEKIYVLGDSLSAAYGLKDPNDGFPAQLDKALKAQNIQIDVINGGVSGDTSTGGAERLEWGLGDVDALNIKYGILELGANDAFRGISPSDTKKALQKSLDIFKAKNIKVLLAGMYAPPNMGDQYEAEFLKIYQELAKENDVVFYPFFLDGVAGDLSLNQPDGIHPTEEGILIVVEKIMPSILTLINR